MLIGRFRVVPFVLLLLATLVGAAATAAQEDEFIWPTHGRITQEYGCTGFVWEPRVGNCRHFHGGIDIANERGTPIKASGDGVVKHIGWDPWGTGAWMVIIKHKPGLVTWYAHLQRRRVDGLREGDRVRQGDLIGYMGNTGMSTGVHLHFSFVKDGRYADPMNYLPGSGRQGRRV